MQDNTFDHELQQRLQLIENGGDTFVADLPLKDFIAVVIALVLLTAALIWWAY